MDRRPWPLESVLGEQGATAPESLNQKPTQMKTCFVAILESFSLRMTGRADCSPVCHLSSNRMPAVSFFRSVGTLLIPGMLLLLCVSANANNHFLKPFNGQAVLYWNGSLSVEGGGAQFIAEELDFNEPSNPFNPRQVVLYRGLTKVNARATFSYIGSLPMVPGSMKINGLTGTEYTQKLDLTDPASDVAYGGWFLVTALVETTDGGGNPVYVSIENTFYADLRVYKALAVELREIGATGARVVTMRRDPYILLNGDTGAHTIGVAQTDWGPAGVVVEPIGAVQIEETGHQQTNENGSLDLTLSADTDNGGGSTGFVNGSFRLQAFVDGCTMERADSLSLPFAVVVSSNNASMVEGEGLGEVLYPLYSGTPLKADTKVQIGNETGAAGHLSIRFCNGQTQILTADPFQGHRAVIGGPDSVQVGPSLLSVRLKSAALEVTNNPRRVGRMVVYKALGNAVDSLMGVPNPVGWTTTSPGGVVESWLADWGEASYDQPSPQSMDSSGSNALRNDPPPVSATLVAPNRTTFDFYTDGSVWVEQQGGGSVSISGPGGTSAVRPGGAVLIRNGQPGAATTSTTAWEAPVAGTITVLPTTGATLNTRRPTLTVQVPAFEAVVWETLSVRLDGREIGGQFPTHGDGTTVWTPGLADALAAGSHTLSARMQTLKGAVLEASTTFNIVAPPPISTHVQGLAFDSGVWLTWVRPLTHYPLRFTLFRQPAGGGAPVVIDADLTQPGCLDSTPLSSALYTVRTVDLLSGETADAPPIQVDWNAALPPPPMADPVEIASVMSRSDGIVIQFRNRSGTAGRFQLERSTAPGGPFTALFPSDWTVAEEVLDTTVTAGTDYYYRLIPLSANGTPGAAVMSAAVGAPAAPGTIDSVRIHTVNGAAPGARISWNPPGSDLAASRIHVQRDTGSGYTQIADLPATETTYFDAAYRPGTTWLYRIVASTASGTEGQAGPGVIAAAHAVSLAPALIGFSSAQLEVGEGVGTATLSLTRVGNLGEPAIIAYAASRMWNDQANAGEDFTPVQGWASFAAGQSNIAVSVPILPDALVENDELFSVSLSSVFGATEPASLEPGRVMIKDQDIILPDNYISTLAVSEAASSVVVPLMRLFPSNRTVSAQVAVSSADSTAVPGMDYGPFTAGRVTFSAGATQGSLSIPLLNELVKDGNKILVVRLQDAQGGCGISEWQQTITITLRDDETHPGQMQFSNSNPVVITPRGASQVTLPVTRTGGTDGSINAMVMIGGGSISWDAVIARTDALVLNEGQTSTEVSIQVNPALFDPRVAPFLILDVMNAEYPNENSQVLVIFPHATGPSGGFAAWAAGQSLPVGTRTTDDHDRDGASELAEFALGTSPLSGEQIPNVVFSFSAWGSFETQHWVRADPDLVIVAEFSDDLFWTRSKLNAGFIEWPTTPNGGANATYFGYPQTGQKAMFARMRFIHLEP